jgi:hypothetical protein
VTFWPKESIIRVKGKVRGGMIDYSEDSSEGPSVTKTTIERIRARSPVHPKEPLVLQQTLEEMQKKWISIEFEN